MRSYVLIGCVATTHIHGGSFSAIAVGHPAELKLLQDRMKQLIVAVRSLAIIKSASHP